MSTQFNRTTIKIITKGRYALSETGSKWVFNAMLASVNNTEGPLIRELGRNYMQDLALRPEHFQGLNPFPETWGAK